MELIAVTIIEKNSVIDTFPFDSKDVDLAQSIFKKISKEINSNITNIELDIALSDGFYESDNHEFSVCLTHLIVKNVA